MEVNHKDGDKTNSIPSNLEWVTPSENVRHAVRTGLAKFVPMIGEKHPMAILDNDRVRKIRRLYAAGHNQVRLAMEFGVSRYCIGKIVLRKNWRHI